MKEKEKTLKNVIENNLPEIARMCKEDAQVVLLHQDAFAADYQAKEYKLLGMAIKYIGLFGNGKEIRIIGKNRETVQGAPDEK